MKKRDIGKKWYIFHTPIVVVANPGLVIEIFQKLSKKKLLNIPLFCFFLLSHSNVSDQIHFLMRQRLPEFIY